MSSGTAQGHAIIGAASGYTLWAFEAIRMLAGPAQGREIVLIDRTHPLPRNEIEGRIFLTQYPGQDLICAIADGTLAPVLLLDDPAESAAFLMRTSGGTLLDAIRAVTASQTANLALAQAPRAEILQRAQGYSARGYVRHLAHCLGLPETDAAAAEALARLSPGLPAEATIDEAIGACHPAHLSAPRPESEAAVARKVAVPLLAMAFGDVTKPVVWPIEVFFSGDNPNTPADAVASVVGPARVMIYGPYLHLPPGEYVVEAEIDFGPRIEDIPFTIEVHSTSCLARARIAPRPAGTYRGSFRLAHHNPVDALEIHVRSERGAIDGTLSLKEIRLFVKAPYFKALE